MITVSTSLMKGFTKPLKIGADINNKSNGKQTLTTMKNISLVLFL